MPSRDQRRSSRGRLVRGSRLYVRLVDVACRRMTSYSCVGVSASTKAPKAQETGRSAPVLSLHRATAHCGYASAEPVRVRRATSRPFGRMVNKSSRPLDVKWVKMILFPLGA